MDHKAFVQTMRDDGNPLYPAMGVTERLERIAELATHMTQSARSAQKDAATGDFFSLEVSVLAMRALAEMLTKHLGQLQKV